MKCDCGWICDRDISASLVILKKGLDLNPEQVVGLGWSELKPLERITSARVLESSPYIRVSYLDEGGSSR